MPATAEKPTISQGPPPWPHCLCGAWADPEDYPGANWDSPQSWCPFHSGPYRRRKTLAHLRRKVKKGEMTQAEYEKLKSQ